MLKNKFVLIVIIVLSLPILLHVYNPAIEMGGFGLLLGFVGMFISPVVIFGTLFGLLVKAFRD